MARDVNIDFHPMKKIGDELVIGLAAEERALGEATSNFLPENLFSRAADTTKFTGKSMSTLDLVSPDGVKAERLVLVGTGDASEMDEPAWLKLGGKIGGIILSSKCDHVSVILERPDNIDFDSEALIAIAGGIKMRAYKFDRYKTSSDNSDEEQGSITVSLVTANHTGAAKLWKLEEGVIDGTLFARTLVNEPANTLGPVEFAAHASDLSRLGVEVEILTEKEMGKLKMGALLGVAQGSVRPPRMAIMKWMGGKKGEQPISFIGKGVVFDTGGISLKPGGGMEDMKGDMGGAAAVIGLMHALAARKAKANVIGVLGLVENMPDGNAQRPGDIVTSMSGQTIEVINTDAEGRLVLCDALHYVNTTYNPKFMINLATLTGAVIIALGNHHAGLFSNDDALSAEITDAGLTSGEHVWRLPLSSDYDKLIDSKFADMKNVGSRAAGSITAAQFLKRYVGDTPWAHIDIAGTAMGSPQTEINKSWASGFGVRLLDRLVRDQYEN
ncbi:MAG: leucyl aminopeptidase [Hyphomicrobiales bacterium]